MSKISMKDIVKKMKKLDLCMMTTVTPGGMTAGRPMCHNGDVEYDGNSYFFTWDKSPLVKDITKNDNVNLSFNGKKQLYLSVAGKAKLVRDRVEMKNHWNKNLEVWFKDGLDTPGIVMIQVKAKKIKFWQKSEEGEITLK